MVSATLRCQVRSVVKKKLRDTCIVSVLAPWAIAFVANVRPGRPEDAHKIETRMLEKALVFGGEQRVHQRFGDILKANPAPLFPRVIEEIGQQLRLDFRALHHIAVIEQLDAADAAARKIDVQCVFALEEGVVKRMDLDDVAVDAVPAGSALDLGLVIKTKRGKLADSGRRASASPRRRHDRAR